MITLKYLVVTWKKWTNFVWLPEWDLKLIGTNDREADLWSKWERPFLQAELCNRRDRLFIKRRLLMEGRLKQVLMDVTNAPQRAFSTVSFMFKILQF